MHDVRCLQVTEETIHSVKSYRGEMDPIVDQGFGVSARQHHEQGCWAAHHYLHFYTKTGSERRGLLPALGFLPVSHSTSTNSRH